MVIRNGRASVAVRVLLDVSATVADWQLPHSASSTEIGNELA